MAAGSPPIHVLMATYNGGRFLDAQINSILGQTENALRLLIRDDGSSDGTVAQAHAAAAADSRITGVMQGQRLGVIGSFFHLLRHSAEDAAYVAFADQDDVWLPDKLARARAALDRQVPEGRPGLYCSRLTYVDEALVPLGQSPLPRRSPGLANALVENIAAGCTIVLNRPAITLLRAVKPPEAVQMHDWWFYMVVAACGTVIYDPQPSLLYRQHGNNVVGAGRGPLSRLARKVRGQLTRPPGQCHRQALALRQAYGDAMGLAERALLDRFLDASASPSRGPGTLRYILGPNRVFRQAPLDDLALRSLMLLGRI